MGNRQFLRYFSFKGKWQDLLLRSSTTNQMRKENRCLVCCFFFSPGRINQQGNFASFHHSDINPSSAKYTDSYVNVCNMYCITCDTDTYLDIHSIQTFGQPLCGHAYSAAVTSSPLVKFTFLSCKFSDSMTEDSNKSTGSELGKIRHFPLHTHTHTKRQ